jgi:heat shock protein HtpX
MALDFRARQAANQRKTILLLAVMACVMAAVVWAVAYYLGYTSIGVVPIAVFVVVGGSWWSYYASDKLVLTMTGARVVDAQQAPQLHNLVEEIALAAGLPKPRIAIVEDTAPNAFATGRDPAHGLIAYTTGILQLMDREELQGVTAHEMSHIGNRDTLVATVAATTAGAIALMTDLAMRIMWFGGGDRRRDNDNNNNPIMMIIALVVMILGPLAALLLKSAVSRSRESLADATGVSFTRNPAGLRRALENLESNTTVVHSRSTALAHLWIESPLDNTGTNKLFMTHPPLKERIAALRQMEGETV